MADCIFCKIVSGDIPAEKVYEDGANVAFLDIKPLNPGHLVVIPKKHIDSIFSSSDTEYKKLFLAVKKLAPYLQNVTGAARIGVVVEGFEVPHAHIKVIPLNAGNELNPERAKSATPEELKEMGDRIRNAM